jgi:hypothetical protein
MPEDLEGKAERLAQAQLDSLTQKQKERLTHQSQDRMSKKAKTEIFAAYMLGGIESADFRLELAKAQLMKPLEATKQMGAFVPKTLETTGEVKHLHAIVVPATLPNDAWNEGQNAIGMAQEEGWGAASPWGKVQTMVDVEEE